LKKIHIKKDNEERLDWPLNDKKKKEEPAVP
jgi:hypothetical protein